MDFTTDVMTQDPTGVKLLFAFVPFTLFFIIAFLGFCLFKLILLEQWFQTNQANWLKEISTQQTTVRTLRKTSESLSVLDFVTFVRPLSVQKLVKVSRVVKTGLKLKTFLTRKKTV
ncbi:MAG: hypothetical protein AAGI66_00540 [Cyanobacteria bacterium P01_H01_bin.74]